MVISLADVRTIDLSDLLSASSLLDRRSASAELRRRLRNLGSQTIVFDTSEGWLTTNAFLEARASYPHAYLVALQHGIFSLRGLRTSTILRRARTCSTFMSRRTLGFSPIGAGFGNLPFDQAIVFGPRFEDYVARLHPSVIVSSEFGTLMGIAPSSRLSGDLDLLFLGQDLTCYLGSKYASLLKSVLAKLAQLNRPGYRVAFRPHPKDRINWTETMPGDLEIIKPKGRFSDRLKQDSIVVSFFSTALVEAAYLGCEILAITVDGIPRHVYDSFLTPMNLEDFTRWTDPPFRASRVTPGTFY